MADWIRHVSLCHGWRCNYLEARGNAYWGNYRIKEHFDSVGMDLVHRVKMVLDPMIVRSNQKVVWYSDEDAYWYDLVFMPGTPTTPQTTSVTNTAFVMVVARSTLEALKLALRYHMPRLSISGSMMWFRCLQRMTFF